VRVNHSISAGFDDPNLISCAGLVPVLALAERAGLHDLVDEHVRVPGSAGSNPAAKIAALIAGMVAGAHTFDVMDLLRHGGMGRLFSAGRAPSTLGTFLRAFMFGHVRQLDAVASRFLVNLVRITPLLADIDEVAYLDIDSRDQGDLRVPEAGRWVRVLRGHGVERPARDRVHPDGCTGDRGYPACGRARRTPRAVRPDWSPTPCTPPAKLAPPGSSLSEPTVPTTGTASCPQPAGAARGSPSPPAWTRP